MDWRGTEIDRIGPSGTNWTKIDLIRRNWTEVDQIRLNRNCLIFRENKLLLGLQEIPRAVLFHRIRSMDPAF